MSDTKPFSADSPTQTQKESLTAEARDARDDAYAPYSEFEVGAAILCTDGTIYTGANIENINHTNTAHAEQVAINTAVHDGKRDFVAMAISCSGEPKPPCGLCRQTLSEFCDEEFLIITNDHSEQTLGELLPDAMETIET